MDTISFPPDQIARQTRETTFGRIGANRSNPEVSLGPRFVISLLQTLNPIFDIAWWILLIAFFVTGFRSYPLPALRWIAWHFLIALFTVPFGQFLTMPLLSSTQPTPLFHPLVGSMGAAAVATAVISALADFVVLVLALSEIASLISRAYSGPHPWVMRLLLRAYEHVRILGISAVALAVAYPIPVITYRLLHGTPTA